jgi:hypothetical protein
MLDSGKVRWLVVAALVAATAMVFGGSRAMANTNARGDGAETRVPAANADAGQSLGASAGNAGAAAHSYGDSGTGMSASGDSGVRL